MDLHVPAPSPLSGDGLYELAEPEPAAPEPEPSPPASPGAGAPASAPATPNAAAEGAKGPVKEKEAVKEPAKVKAKRRRKRKTLRTAVPAWVVSLAVHLSFLGLLAAATFTSEGKKIVANLNSALVSTSNGGEKEEVLVYADPSNQKSDQAVGSEKAETVGGSGGTTGGTGTGFGGIGTGPPSATPALGKVGRVGDGSGGTGLGGLKIGTNLSGISLLPAAPGLDIGGGGMVAGDVAFEAKDVGASLDQIAREILRHLESHKITVVWLFDESESMKDDQKAIREKFDRVSTELKLNVDNSKKSAGALNHAIVGFGEGIDYVLEKPTVDIDAIGRAISKLKIDNTGTENTLHAITDVIAHYGGLIRKDRRLLIVLVTDESGDDGAYIEEAHQAAKDRGVPIYVIGRQSLFGYERAHLQYVDPVTKDVYWPSIRRGPETADVELLQWDGLHERWDEQPSGFAPYELARMAKATGGIYFLLPSEENMRVRQREKAYKIADLKEYIPDYANRTVYADVRSRSEFRRTLYAIIQETRGYPYPRHFSIDPSAMIPAAHEAANIATARLTTLLAIQKRLEGLQKLRDREPAKRWQAHYDLMLAQIVAYQLKAYEYRACLDEMVKSPPRPKAMPSESLQVEWVIDHSHDRKAAKSETEKKYVEAINLLKGVIARHPNTPWADLAQDELNRGLGAQRNEWHHNPKYNERAKLVPKY